jgi:hypothetical protein
LSFFFFFFFPSYRCTLHHSALGRPHAPPQAEERNEFAEDAQTSVAHHSARSLLQPLCDTDVAAAGGTGLP